MAENAENRLKFINYRAVVGVSHGLGRLEPLAWVERRSMVSPDADGFIGW